MMGSQAFGVDDALHTLVLIIATVLLIAALPTWPYSAGWGYYLSGLHDHPPHCDKLLGSSAAF
jgi:Protein of unknown function (DUF3309)